jgi:hypothetical protein
MNDVPSIAFKKYDFKKKIVIHMDLWKYYGPILTVQKSQTII